MISVEVKPTLNLRSISNMLKNVITAVLVVASSALLNAQNKVTFTGAGRFVLENNQIGGNLIDDTIISGDTMAADTTNARRSMSGFALFDLGFDIRPNASTEIKAVTRVTNDLDGFWGAGIGFSVRELYAKGLIRGKVRYHIGDMNVKMTPYTLYNSNSDLGQRRPEMYRVFNDIIEYEHFYLDNQWRQQGLRTDFSLLMPEVIDEIAVEALVTKNRHTDYFFTPDRLLLGSRVKFIKEELGFVRYNQTRFFELPQTAQFSNGESSFGVHTVDWNIKPLTGSDYFFIGEMGLSNTRYENVTDAPADTMNYFMDLRVAAHFMPINIKAQLGFRSIESGFRSPGAQSRRTDYNGAASTFTYYTNQEQLRPVSLADIYRDVNIYSPFLSMQLQDYQVAYSNVLPYGEATPNRRGWTVNLESENDSASVPFWELEAQVLTENTGMGINAYRKFLLVDGFAQFALNKIWNGEKATLFELHGRFENTTRDGLSGLGEKLDGIGAIDLTSWLVQAGIDAEISNDLHFLASIMQLNASGNEFLAQRNGFNGVQDYAAVDVDLTEQILGAGLQYKFTETIQLTVQFQRSTWENQNEISNSYNWNQLSVIYNMFF
jgi:hypothetical protein